MMVKDFADYRKQLKVLFGKLHKEAPETFGSFNKLHEKAMAAGALDVKHKELIALGIAIASRCDGCITFHVYEALASGASRQEIVETLSVGVLMGGGPSLMYSAHALEALEQFEAATV